MRKLFFIIPIIWIFMSCEESIYLEEKDVSNGYVSIASSPNILKSTSI